MKKREVSKISSTYTDFLGRPAKWIVMTLFAIAVIGPLYWLFTNAIKVKADYLSSPPVIIPTRVTFENFVSIFKNDGVGKGLYNSIVITVVSTILASSFGSLAAYSLTKGRLRKPIRSVLACWFLLQKMYPAIATAIPIYLVMRDLHLIDTKTAMIILNTSFNFPMV